MNKLLESRKDAYFALGAGVLSGPLFLVILKAAKPQLYESYALIILLFFFFAIPIGLIAAYQLSKLVPIIWQLAKFCVSGGVNMLIDLGILAFLTFLFRFLFLIEPGDIIFTLFYSLSFYTVYKSISFIIANINSFFWNRYWTFEKKNAQSSKEYLQFFSVSVLGLIINAFTASFVFRSITPPLGFDVDQWVLIGGVAGSVVGLAWNFIGYKFLVFKK